MVWNRYRDGCIRKLALHDDMAAALTDIHKAVLCKDSTDIRPGKDSDFRHILPIDRALDCDSQRRDVGFLAHSLLDFRRAGGFQKQFNGFSNIAPRFLHRFALTDDIEFRAERNKPLFGTLNNCGELRLELRTHTQNLSESAGFCNSRLRNFGSSLSYLMLTLPAFTGLGPRF